jgi:hypothetical protein
MPAGVPSWLARGARLAPLIALPVLAAFVVREVLTGKFGGAALDLSHAAPAWIVAALAAEVLSYLMYAAAQRRLLGPSAQGIGVRWLASLSVCAQGVNNFLPAGYVAANLLNFRELRRRNLAGPMSAWLLVTTSALYIGVLAVLTLLAGVIAGGHTGSGLQDMRIGAAIILVALPLALVVGRRLLRRGVIRLPEAWRTGPERPPSSRPRAATAAGLFGLAWSADAGCLIAAVHAVGAHPDWNLVPIAYCGAQLVSFLPLTPGGLGLVEGSLAVTLVSGGAGSAVLAAVLLYRLISYWGTLPFGLLAYLAVRRARLAGSTNLDGNGYPAPALGDRAPRTDRALLVLEG